MKLLVCSCVTFRISSECSTFTHESAAPRLFICQNVEGLPALLPDDVEDDFGVLGADKKSIAADHYSGGSGNYVERDNHAERPTRNRLRSAVSDSVGVRLEHIEAVELQSSTR